MKYLFVFFNQMLLLMFITLILFFTVISSSLANQTNALQGLGQPIYHSVKALKSKSNYQLIVRLPNGYDNKTKYPTIYLLDGGISYPLLSAYYHYLRFTDEIPAMIIVGISYGTDDWQKGNARSVDYTVGSPQRKHWGGAETFQNVLESSVLPLIENNYAADPSKRLIFGNSLAGQFVLYTAMTKPSLFAGHIASNPALHQNLSFFLDKNNVAPSVIIKPKLFVSSGSKDDIQFREPALKWMQHWQNNNFHPWLLKTETLHYEGHMSAIPTAFVRGVRWALNSP